MYFNVFKFILIDIYLEQHCYTIAKKHEMLHLCALLRTISRLKMYLIRDWKGKKLNKQFYVKLFGKRIKNK